MPVVRLLHVFSTFAVGGPQRRFAQLVNALGDKYEHFVVSMDRNTAAATLVDPGVNFRVLDAMDGRPKTIRNTFWFRRILKQFRPDVLVTYNWGATEWALANRVFPICRHVHIEDGFGPEEVERQIGRRVLFRRLVLSGKHTRIIVPSSLLHELAIRVWGFAPSKISLIVNGVDIGRFETAAKLGVRGGSRIVAGTVCALRPEKNLHRLIEAFALAAQTQDIFLHIAGDGPERKKLEESARQQAVGDRIVFLGATDRPEDFLASIDIFALSSDTEQMPLGVLEAMASALPVASVDVGDVARMVAAENRPFIVPAGDTEALSRTIGLLADNKDLRTSVGQSNLARAKSAYDLKDMVDAYDRLFGGDY